MLLLCRGIVLGVWSNPKLSPVYKLVIYHHIGLRGPSLRVSIFSDLRRAKPKFRTLLLKEPITSSLKNTLSPKVGRGPFCTETGNNFLRTSPTCFVREVNSCPR